MALLSTDWRATKLEAVLPGFDETMAKVKALGESAGQRLTSIGEVIDRGVGALNSLFLEKGADGQTKIDQLIASLQNLINGPEGQKDQSIRGQLETIVGNLRASSESILRLADVQGKEQGSIGEVLRTFEETAKRLSEDAETAQRLTRQNEPRERRGNSGQRSGEKSCPGKHASCRTIS